VVRYETGARHEVGDPGAAVRRWRRRVVGTIVVYSLVVVITHALVLIGVVAARLVGERPTTDMAGVHNFRTVDSETWAGGQPEADAYRELAARGVRLVVDLRTGSRDDPRKDDPGLLERLGVGYLALPVPDGHVPSEAQVGRFLAAVRETGGVVFVHCGGGVGRTSALTAAYLRATGAGPGLVDTTAVGPHTIEQLWFVATGDTNPLVRRTSELLDAPRRGWSRLRALV
jgi:protein tyrosine phosphatase (PTP) superfamily phosphohydrolase (DUF442 family)